ncbi:hypothetical protein TomTYG45_10860 [Sphingobium sp. TomTYG45]
MRCAKAEVGTRVAEMCRKMGVSRYRWKQLDTSKNRVILVCWRRKGHAALMKGAVSAALAA